MQTQRPATPPERRQNTARRDAFDQRDRSKRLDDSASQQKAGVKLGAGESTALRMI